MLKPNARISELNTVLENSKTSVQVHSKLMRDSFKQLSGHVEDAYKAFLKAYPFIKFIVMNPSQPMLYTDVYLVDKERLPTTVGDNPSRAFLKSRAAKSATVITKPEPGFVDPQFAFGFVEHPIGEVTLKKVISFYSDKETAPLVFKSKYLVDKLSTYNVDIELFEQQFDKIIRLLSGAHTELRTAVLAKLYGDTYNSFSSMMFTVLEEGTFMVSPVPAIDFMNHLTKDIKEYTLFQVNGGVCFGG